MPTKDKMTDNHIHLCKGMKPPHLWQYDHSNCQMNEYETYVTCEEHRDNPARTFKDWFATIEKDCDPCSSCMEAAFLAGQSSAIEASAKVADEWDVPCEPRNDSEHTANRIAEKIRELKK